MRCIWIPPAILLCASLFLEPRSTQAQEPSPAAEAVQDSLRQRYHDTLIALRDMLSGVRGRLQAFRLDLDGVGAETVVARASRLRWRCVGAIGALRDAEAVFQPREAPTARTREAARSLVGEMQALQQALQEHCERAMRSTGPGQWADSLRAWGPFRTSRVEEKLAAYDHAAARFARVAGFKLEPGVPKP